MKTVGEKVVISALVLLSGGAAMMAAKAGERMPPQAPASSVPAQQQPPQSSRLRFRSGGPACMCVNGLGEEDIAEAERRRRDGKIKELQSIIQDQ